MHFWASLARKAIFASYLKFLSLLGDIVPLSSTWSNIFYVIITFVYLFFSVGLNQTS